MLSQLKIRIQSALRRLRVTDDDLPGEMEHHLEALIEERRALGETEQEAMRFARRKLGNLPAISESVREEHSLHIPSVMLQHARLAVRTAVRNRGPYLAAAGILSLGIGMSVAMFSLVDVVLIRPLPFSRQEAIHVIWKSDPLAGNHVGELAYPELRDLQEGIPDFEYVALMPPSLYGYARVLQTGKADPVQIEASVVSHDFFRVLGVSPVLGRNFEDSDEHVGAAPVVMLSQEVWQNQLGGDRGIVGRQIRLNGQGHTVIGVMPRGVEFPRGAGLWVLLGVDERFTESRDATFLQAIARARPGVSRERIASQVNTLFRRLAAEYPQSYLASQRGVVTPLTEYWAGSARLHLWMMLGASLLLLAASIVSAGNLLLSRTQSRRSEIATRLSLGARRGQIVQQLAAEAFVIAFAAVALGLVMAKGAVSLLVRWAPDDIPRLSEATLDWNAFFFAAGVAALAAGACTIVPAWSAARMQLEPALREGGTRLSSSRRGNRTRSLFVTMQAALTVTLLAVALLLVLSYRSMMMADTGFANRDAVTMNLQLRNSGVFAGQGIGIAERRRFYRRLLEQVREAPGVSSAAAVLLRPLEGTIGWDAPYEFEFEAARTDRKVLPKTNYEVVTPGYFETVGTAMLVGRDFDEHDSEDGEPVVIISDSLAQRIRAAGFLPIGYRMRHGLNFKKWSKIVGVVADGRYRSITQRGADVFVPYTQAAQPTNYVVIRGSRRAGELSALVRGILKSMDAGQTVSGIATIGELIDRNAVRHRFNMTLLLWFAACSALLAAMGVYSVISEAIAEREREISIKNALGAGRTRLLREMIFRTLVFVVIGEMLGAGGAALAARLGSELFYGVSAGDPLVLGGVVAFLFLVSLASASWPAWFAAGRNPNALLKAS